MHHGYKTNKQPNKNTDSLSWGWETRCPTLGHLKILQNQGWKPVPLDHDHINSRYTVCYISMICIAMPTKVTHPTTLEQLDV